MVTALASLSLLSGPSMPAQAAPAPPGAVYKTADNYCHYRNWAGTFYCGTGRIWTRLDTYPQVFVIGPNLKVYTRWSTATTLTAWSDALGGTCRPERGLVMVVLSDTTLQLQCVGSDGYWWYIYRGPTGGWTDWDRL
ncbi:hypothetical protein ACQPZX_14615 [Actinoplanes sp. CA-142083]|uniref:hypothetical protein n=1 Tax=Actinoplanes sp. CA-142083 TaxID=3239903 RepID=UPI003D8A8429